LGYTQDKKEGKKKEKKGGLKLEIYWINHSACPWVTGELWPWLWRFALNCCKNIMIKRSWIEGN